MSIPADVYKVAFGGTLPGGEVWESGFWVHGALPTSNSEANTTAELWYAQLTASDGSGGVYGTAAVVWGDDVVMTYVKIYAYPTGGTTAAFIGEYSGTPKAGSGTTTVPNQICLVVSLRTANAGRQYRGRMYLPASKLAGISNGNVPTSDATAMATAWGTCFSDWNASGDNGQVVVVSRVGAGHYDVVDVVRVDTIPDTQRKRSNKLQATSIAQMAVTT